MRRSTKRAAWKAAGIVLAAVLIGVLFFSALGNLRSGQGDEGRAQLEKAVRRAAVSCYATEGFYPPTLDYMRDHYALQIDETRYCVFYSVWGENIMTDITVTEVDTE